MQYFWGAKNRAISKRSESKWGKNGGMEETGVSQGLWAPRTKTETLGVLGFMGQEGPPTGVCAVGALVIPAAVKVAFRVFPAPSSRQGHMELLSFLCSSANLRGKNTHVRGKARNWKTATAGAGRRGGYTSQDRVGQDREV